MREVRLLLAMRSFK